MTTTNLDPLGDANDVRRIGGIPISLVRSESTLLVVLLAIVLLIGGIVVPSVFQLSNLANMSRDAAVVGLGAIGVTFVLLTGELDLSIGSIMSLSLVVGGEFVDEGPVLALLVTALCGLVLGAVNGLAVGYGRVNSLIMTLGTLALYSGLASVVTKGQAIYLKDAVTYTWFGRGTVLGIPVPVLIFAVVTAITTLVLTSTRIGRMIYFTGANPSRHGTRGSTSRARSWWRSWCRDCSRQCVGRSSPASPDESPPTWVPASSSARSPSPSSGAPRSPAGGARRSARPSAPSSSASSRTSSPCLDSAPTPTRWFEAASSSWS